MTALCVSTQWKLCKQSFKFSSFLIFQVNYMVPIDLNNNALFATNSLDVTPTQIQPLIWEYPHKPLTIGRCATIVEGKSQTRKPENCSCYCRRDYSSCADKLAIPDFTPFLLPWLDFMAPYLYRPLCTTGCSGISWYSTLINAVSVLLTAGMGAGAEVASFECRTPLSLWDEESST
jgi:hypothetical protein